jgi:hypothetical protein
VVIEDINGSTGAGFEIQPITSYFYLSERHLFGDTLKSEGAPDATESGPANRGRKGA